MSDSTPPPGPPNGPPPEITHLVRERTEARTRQDWPRADAIKAQIEAAGWRIVDRGNRTSVSPAAPPAVQVDGELRYGSASAVESLLDEPATTAWTVVVVASEAPEQVSRLLAALRAHAPGETQVVVVANDPSDSQSAALRPGAPDRSPIGGRDPEVLRTSARLGYAAALNIGLRRATGELVLLADATARPTGDAMGPLAAALHDPAVAAAGGFGLVSTEAGPLRPGSLRRLGDLGSDIAGASQAARTAGPADTGLASSRDTAEVVALEGSWLAFRRSDYGALGPLDERFLTPAWLDVWWTLRLRAGADPESAGNDESEPGESNGTEQNDGDSGDRDQADESTAAAEAPEVDLPAPRSAVRLQLPLEREAVAWPPDRSRFNRRNMYRVLDRFGWRDDLA